MPLYHAFEIATDGSFDLHVDQNEETLIKVLENLQDTLKAEGEEIETIALSTVEAESVEAALNKIRSDDWQYSQKL